MSPSILLFEKDRETVLTITGYRYCLLEISSYQYQLSLIVQEGVAEGSPANRVLEGGIIGGRYTASTTATGGSFKRKLQQHCFLHDLAHMVYKQ